MNAVWQPVRDRLRLSRAHALARVIVTAVIGASALAAITSGVAGAGALVSLVISILLAAVAGIGLLSTG